MEDARCASGLPPIKYAHPKVSVFYWWGWMESNHLPSGYEPPALTDELQPRASGHYSVLSCSEL